MITRFDVENYKSIKRLSLEMKPFMVLVGPNGAGKTNIVQALALFGEILTRRNTAPVTERAWGQVIHREKKPARGGLCLAVTASLPLSDQRIEVCAAIALKGKVDDPEVTVAAEHLTVRSAKGQLKVTRKGSAELVYDIGDDPALWPAVSPFLLGGARRRSPMKREEAEKRLATLTQAVDALTFEAAPGDLTLLPRFAITRALLRACQTTRLRLDTSSLRRDDRIDARAGTSLGENGEGLAAVVHRLQSGKRGAFPSILAALRDVYPRIEDVVPEPFGGGRFTLNFKEQGILDPIPLDSVSDGVLHALAILVALATSAGGCLAIEEPENAIHPWSVRKLVERCQAARPELGVILTTHSETVVDAIKSTESLFIVETDARDGTRVTAATSEEEALDAIMRESGQTLGDVWLGGSLGGVPT